MPTTTRIELPTVTPQDLAKTFGDPTYVATDIPYRSQAEVDEAAKALADELASSFAEFEGTARGNPKLRAGASVTHRRAGGAVRREVHDHHLPAPLRPADRLLDLLLGDRSTGSDDAGAGLGRRAREGAGRHRDRPGQRRGRPREGRAGEAHLSVAVGGLRQRLGAYGACRPPARTGAGQYCPRSATRCSSAFEAQGDFSRPYGTGWAEQRGRHPRARIPRTWSIRPLGSG